MADLNRADFTAPSQDEFLIMFSDWKGFVGFSKGRDSLDIYNHLNHFYMKCSEIVCGNGGMIIKYMGDSCLAIFDKENAEKGILASQSLKFEIDNWLKKQNSNCRLTVNCHFGEVTIGPMGGGNFQVIDIIGQSVNTCVRLGTNDFNISPQAFRCLSSETRKLFKKFTPPITYHPIKNQ